MGPERTQDSTGWCYAFAATALVQELYCRGKSPACRFDSTQDDRLSVLDLMKIGNLGRGGLISGGHSDEMLDRMASEKKLALETCAPFAPVLNHQQIVNLRTQTPEWAQKIRDANTQILAHDQSRDCEISIATKLKKELGLSLAVGDILQALQKANISIVYSDLLVPKDCEAKRVRLPDLKPQKLQYASLSDTKAKITELLDKKRPMVVNLCSIPPNEAHPSVDPRFDTQCGGHALVLRGSRQKCCGNQACQTEYQVFDSGGVFNSHELSPGNWVNESVIMERLVRKKTVQTDNINLVWLE